MNKFICSLIVSASLFLLSGCTVTEVESVDYYDPGYNTTYVYNSGYFTNTPYWTSSYYYSGYGWGRPTYWWGYGY